jgi:predicted phosphodiesterase
MKICFVSDCHIDLFSPPKIEWPEAEVLLITGDTANYLGGVEKLLHWVRGKYEHVLYVDGNHENYSNAPQKRTVEETELRLRDICGDQAVYLPLMDYHKIGDIYFVGRNGWYSMDYDGLLEANLKRWNLEMNDNEWVGFGKIAQPMPWELARQHADDFKRIMGDIVLADPAARIIAMTHTAPTLESLSTDPKHMLDNPFYVNMYMEEVIDKFNENIIVWTHGHTHYRQDKRISGIEFIVNPRGYVGQNKNWEPVVIDY